MKLHSLKNLAAITIVALLIITIFISTASTPVIPSPKSVFGAVETKQWRSLDAKSILAEHGKTVNGEKNLNEVRRKQGKEFFTLKYDKISYEFFNENEIRSISTTDPEFIGPRGSYVGMDQFTLLSLFPCTNKAIKQNIKSKTQPIFTDEMLIDTDHCEQDSLLIYELGNSDKMPYYFSALHHSPDDHPNQYTIHYTHSISKNCRSYSYCQVEYLIADGFVAEMKIHIINIV